MSIRIHVDPTNPGQFFACCGLLELTNRLWGKAEGWFEDNGTIFCIEPFTSKDSGDCDDYVLANAIAECSVTNTMTDLQLNRRNLLLSMSKKTIESDPLLESEKKILDALWREAPVIFGAPINIKIDWFLDKFAGGSVFKTWAGQQSVIDIVHGMQGSAIKGEWHSTLLTTLLPKRVRSDCPPFNFDADLGSIGGDRDVGFSFDPLRGINVDVNIQVRPVIELLAFIGLQRFHPMRVGMENRFRYSLWLDPLLPEVATVAACGLLAMPKSIVYEFRLLYRTKYLKSFLAATPISRRHYE